jgi:hypothetical protein
MSFAIDFGGLKVFMAGTKRIFPHHTPPIAVNGNVVMEADVDGQNGVIHIIDGVLFAQLGE